MLTCLIRLVSPVKAPRRKYCSASCAREAVRVWKRDIRKHTRDQWYAGRTTVPPWMEGWKSAEARREYYRDYMRRWRDARRTSARFRAKEAAWVLSAQGWPARLNVRAAS